MTPKILVSACLLGQPVRYNGRAMTLEHEHLDAWSARGMIVPLCPEVVAGFSTPRRPAEIESGFDGQDVLEGRGRILDDAGADVTETFLKGARIALETAQRENCRYALLTDGSPSCGSKSIHAGRHDGTRRAGQGVVAACLRGAGIAVFAQHEIARLAREIGG